jgi:poly(beta-D-mannuronate) C5 epimerase
VNPSNMRLRNFPAAAALVAATAAAVVVVTPAAAEACTTPVRYASSSNTIYLVAKKVFTLTSIKRACAAAPLLLVDPASHTWQLNADLVVQNGATMVLQGTALGGDVDTLRLRSRASSRPTEVSEITANYGNIEMDTTRVTSWDDAANKPDTNWHLPSHAPAGSRGRASIRAISTLAPDGATALRSAMTIKNSDVGYLGYYAAESYGLVYKARGCDRTHRKVCERLRVGGGQSNSRLHDNYMGTYTWGAKGMTFRNNSYDHNVEYGLDPHDVSTDLTIDRNRFANNGHHGLICSQLCDHLTITNNESHHNGLVPWTGPSSGQDTDGEVHGIMIHRGVSNSVISGNRVHDQPNGAGISIFDSADNTVRDNILDNNLVGIRISVGSANNTIRNNTIKHSGRWGFSVFKGNDEASYTTPSGRPTGNIFDANTIDGTGENGVRFADADRNRLSNGSISGAGGSLLFATSVDNVLDHVKLSPTQHITVTGSGTQRSSLIVSDPPGCPRVTLDAYSTCSPLS